MKKNHGLALLEVLLAIILIAVITAGSYSLVKSMSVDAGMKKFTRYATVIAKSYQPFLDSSVVSTVFSKNTKTLSRAFLQASYIPDSDLGCNGTSVDSTCVVFFDLPGKYTDNNYMKFDIAEDRTTGDQFFVIVVYDIVPADQKDQMLQSLGSDFSFYCPIKECQLGQGASYVKLVYPKAGSTIPKNEDS